MATFDSSTFSVGDTVKFQDTADCDVRTGTVKSVDDVGIYIEGDDFGAWPKFADSFNVIEKVT